jgi:hypothetical protein
VGAPARRCGRPSVLLNKSQSISLLVLITSYCVRYSTRFVIRNIFGCKSSLYPVVTVQTGICHSFFKNIKYCKQGIRTFGGLIITFDNRY